MKLTKYITVQALVLLILASCNSSANTDYGATRPKTETELKQELKNKECLKAATYVKGTLKYAPKYKNALSMKVKGLKLTCDIRNNAILATVKDIKAKVIFESKTGAKILETTFDIYEFIKPQGTFQYKTQISITNQQYKDLDHFKWSIVNAGCK